VGRTMRFGLCALGLLGCLNAAAGSPVWAIRGEHNTVYLGGSVHLLKAGEAQLPAGFDQAYRGSRELVMELAIDKLDPMEAASWMLEHGTLKEGATLRTTIGEDRYRRVGVEAERLGVPLEVLDQLQPWALALQLLELQYMRLGFDPQQGVEQQLEQRAQSDGKPIQGLETLDEQLGLLQRMSAADQARFLDLTLAEMGDVERQTQSVVSAWRSGDAGRLAGLLSEEYRTFPALYRVLVTERNQRWVPQIERLLHDERDYFVVVGALHLVGEGGLLDLMRRDGYKPEILN
jgi:uncharacterized protein